MALLKSPCTPLAKGGQHVTRNPQLETRKTQRVDINLPVAYSVQNSQADIKITQTD